VQESVQKNTAIKYCKNVEQKVSQYCLQYFRTKVLQLNQKHWDSAHLCQGTSYQCHDTGPDCPPNLIICSLAHCEPSLKISCKSIWKFVRKVANRQTNKDDYMSSLAEVTNYYNKY